MEDDAIRGLTVVKDGAITWPPRRSNRPGARAQAKPPPVHRKEIGHGHGTAQRPDVRQDADHRFRRWRRCSGPSAPTRPGFLGHFTVFVLACFVGYMVVWNVTPALHTPLMSVTNAISSIIAIGALVQIAPPAAGEGANGRPDGLILWLAFAAVLTAINMFGGFCGHAPHAGHVPQVIR